MNRKEEEFEDGPGEVECLECGRLISDDDTGNHPYCADCWDRLMKSGFFEP